MAVVSSAQPLMRKAATVVSSSLGHHTLTVSVTTTSTCEVILY